MSKLDASTRVFVASVAMLLTAGLPISALGFQEIVETTKDAEIRQGTPASGQNFGGQLVNDVRSQRAANVTNRRSIVGFNFTDGEFLGCTVDSATFQMYLQATSHDRTHDVHPLSGAWAENTITWDSAALLTAGALAASATVDNDTDPATISWTGLAGLAQAAIDNQSELTLRVKDSVEQTTTGTGVNFNAQYTSREGAAVAEPPPNSFAPRLVLELTCDECELWADETAWADGDRYENPGNWATYTEYAADTTVTLYAGQTYEAGTVNFAPDNGDVAITITLNSGFRFADDPEMENVKVENYASAPSGNPSPGGFSDKDYADPEDNTFEIIVPLNNFYGVHVDVERCADDDVPDA